ncbi:MAG: hypothetical protein QXO47_05850 [Thermoproteota archaeon]
MKRSSEDKMSHATVWMWGDDLEAVRVNSEKYVSKRWRETIKECVIGITGRERDEGTIFYLTAYSSNPEGIGDLAERLLNVALNLEGDVKVDFVTILLSDHMNSGKELYRDDLEHVEEEYERNKRILTERFSMDPRVKTKSGGREIIVVPEMSLKCELDSDYASKIITDVVDFDFQRVKNFIHSLSKNLIQEGLAKHIVGYKLFIDTDRLEIENISIHKDKVYVRLATLLS